MRKLTIAPLLVVPFLACGGDDGNSNKVSVKTDAKTYLDAPAGSGGGSCEANDTYTMFLGSAGASIYDYPAAGTSRHRQDVVGAISAGSDGKTDDIFYAQFVDGSGSGLFPGGLTTGTQTINTDDGLPFWSIIPNIANSGSNDAEFNAYIDQHAYWPVSGSVTLTAEGGSGMTVSGTFQNLDLVHYIANGNMLTPANDDGSGGSCESMIANLSFSGVAKDGNAKYRTYELHVTGIESAPAGYTHAASAHTLTNRY